MRQPIATGVNEMTTQDKYRDYVGTLYMNVSALAAELEKWLDSTFSLPFDHPTISTDGLEATKSRVDVMALEAQIVEMTARVKTENRTATPITG